MADALGAHGKPMMRVHTAGSVGGSTVDRRDASHRDRTCTTVCSRWRTRSRPRATRSGASPAAAAAAWARAASSPRGCARTSRSRARPSTSGGRSPSRTARTRSKNPYAHLQLKDISIEKVKESPMLWEPIHFLESCPSSDGACAMVLTNEEGAKKAPRPPAWVLATTMRSELGTFPGRDTVRPQAGVECSQMLLRGRRDHEPARADRRRRALRAVLVVRADVARGPRHRRARRGVAHDRQRRRPRSPATSR